MTVWRRVSVAWQELCHGYGALGRGDAPGVFTSIIKLTVAMAEEKVADCSDG